MAKSLKHVLSGIVGKHGENILRSTKKVRVFPSPLKVLNLLTGIGGFPACRIVELYSPEGCGKTTLGLQMAAVVQSKGLKVVWVDFENCFLPGYAKRFGVDCDPERFILLKPEWAEQGFDAILRLLEVEGIGLVVIDSIAAATPKAEADVLGYASTQPGLQSRVVTGFIKNLNLKLDISGTLVIVINQLRAAISFDTHMPTTQTTPGGNALKFYASMRIYLQKGKAVTDSGEEIKEGETSRRATAHIVHVHVTKNKLAVPFRKGDIMLVHGQGFKDAPVDADKFGKG